METSLPIFPLLPTATAVEWLLLVEPDSVLSALVLAYFIVIVIVVGTDGPRTMTETFERKETRMVMVMKILKRYRPPHQTESLSYFLTTMFAGTYNSSPSQISNTLLTTALIIGFNNHS